MRGTWPRGEALAFPHREQPKGKNKVCSHIEFGIAEENVL